MDEMTRLADFRSGTAPMSAKARFRGRQQLMDGIAGRQSAPAGRGVLRSRRVLVAAAMTMAITGGLVGTQIVGPGAGESSAEAVSALNLAADALADLAAKTPTPRPDQFLYTEVLHTTGSPKDTTVSEGWRSVDGSKAGVYRSTGAYENSGQIDPYPASGTILNSSYLELAKLPTDPDKLLAILDKDPAVLSDEQGNGTKHEVAVWGVVRDLIDGAVPPAQEAALFRAAAKLPHISYVRQATDATGREGEAVSMVDPRVGAIQLILDRQTHTFLGERVLGKNDDAVQFNSALRRTAFVDQAYQQPS
ncbi:CU044_5270 family protein [Kitasatospora sp. NPDC057198]|uniref:CU044_5270 family protein n=1 Tax=Kitasatospora sp. NPDC057198 TaxID=3346046 RepID=UPI00363B547E